MTSISRIHPLKRLATTLLVLVCLALSHESVAKTATVEEVRSLARLYFAAFDRQPNISGLNFWVDSLESNVSYIDIAKRFYESPEFKARYGPLTDEKYVAQLYQNVLGRAGAESGTTFWLQQLAKGASRALVLSKFSDSPENIAKTSELFGDMRFVGGRWVFGPGDGFTLSGKIVPPSATAVDSDTNDPFAPYRSNDTPNDAPSIPNPVTLGGYVNEPGTGEAGRSRLTGDRDDYFRVELLAGQVITMFVSDYVDGDADLYLYDSNGYIVDVSEDTGEIESLKITESGMYFINPYAYSGASNYILTIGNVNISTENAGLRLSSEFVPGQAIVGYDESLLQSQSGSVQAMASAGGFRVRAGSASRPMLLELAPDGVSAAAIDNNQLAAYQKADSARTVGERVKLQTLAGLKVLRKDPLFKYVEPNYIVQAAAIPNDPYFPLQWHYQMINLPAAWDLETGDPGVIVAVIDTGVILNHPDLRDKLVPGYDFISDIGSAADGNGIDNNPNDPGDSNGTQPSSFHGTHVAGTIAATTNNGLGVAGIAWGVGVMPVRVLGTQGGNSYDLAQGIRWAAGLPNDSGTIPAQRADIINLSLGGYGFTQAEKDAVSAARNAGVVIVAAAGNESQSRPFYPAAFSGVISVSAVDIEGRLASYSNFGPTIDLSAPGGDLSYDKDGNGYPDGIFSTGADDSSGSVSATYLPENGTSMAAPHVSGVIALMKSANSAVSPAVVDNLLSSGELTVDIGPRGRDDSFGNGLINARKAVTAALDIGQIPLPPVEPMLGVTPASLNFDAETTGIEIDVRNINTGSLALNSITTDQPWLSVASVSVDSKKLGKYLVTVDRGGLLDGIYSGSISLKSSTNNVTIPIFMSVSVAAGSANVGYIYVLLIDADNNNVVEQVIPDSSGGVYPYKFTNIPAGNYNIVAGTDSDNDIFICDSGEACGAYTTVDQPVDLNVNGNSLNLNFPIGYRVALPSPSAAGARPAKASQGVFRNKQPLKFGHQRLTD